MARSCASVEKVFQLGKRLSTLTDSRPRPRIPPLPDPRPGPPTPPAALSAAVFPLSAPRRGSLNGLDQDLRVPARLRGIVGPTPPSVDSIGRISALMDSSPLRQLLRDIAHR